MNLTESIRELQSKLDSLDTSKTREIDSELKEIERLTYLPILDKKQVCKLLQIGPTTLNKWISEGAISFFKKGGVVLFEKEDVVRFLEKNKQS